MLKITAGVAGLFLIALAQPAAAQQQCNGGAQSFAVTVANTAHAAVTATLREHKSGNPWQSITVAAGKKESLPVCILTTLGVGDLAYNVIDGSGATFCKGSRLVQSGGAVTLSVADGGACDVVVAR